MLSHKNSEDTASGRLVLLGGSGFVGKAVAASAGRRGFEVCSLGSADIDLTSASAAEKLRALIAPSDIVVMLSVLAPSRGRDTPTMLANLRMAETAVTAFDAATPAHIVYVSSEAVYGTDVARVTADTPAQPTDLYGTMHRMRELMFAERFADRLAVLRPSLIYGAGDPHNSYGPNRFRRQARKDLRIPLFGGGEETRDHVYVADVAEVILRVALRRSCGTEIVAFGQSISFKDVAASVARHFSDAVAIVPSDRKNPITHRSYDILGLRKAFPDLILHEIERGIGLAQVAELAE